MNDFNPDRRRLLGGTAAASLLSAAAPLKTLGQGTLAALAATQAIAAVPTDRVTVLYRPETPASPNRVDPVIMGVTRALETEFLRSNFRLQQPTPDVLALMDRGQEVAITFAEDAGFTMVYSAYTDLRPAPGQEAGIAEVRLSGRVFVGRHTLSMEEGRGQMFTRMEGAQRDFGVRRAYELAGQRAAADLATRISNALRALTSEQLAQMVPDKPSSAMTHVVVPLPPGGSSTLPPAAPAPAPAAPAPVPVAPAPAPVPVAPAPVPVVPPQTPQANTVPATPPATPAAPAPSAPPAPVAASPSPAAAPSASRPIGNRWGMVICMSDYSSVRRRLNNKITDLPGVGNDFRLAMSTLAELGFAKERTAGFLNEQCTSQSIKHSLKFLADKVQPDDVVVIFISAHGGDKQYSPSRFGMPILADYTPGNTDNLDFWELQGMLKNLPGRVVWINDTCHSGGAALNMSSVEVSSRGVQVLQGVRGPDARQAAAGAPGQEVAVLSACQPAEISWEDGAGGLFATKLFRELSAARGKMSLEQVFKERVYGHVVNRSKEICVRASACGQHPQQTPVMAFQGGGSGIVL